MQWSKSSSSVFLNLYLLKYSPIALEKFYYPIKYISCFIVAAPFEYVIPSNIDSATWVLRT
jgi:hypothetical protein